MKPKMLITGASNGIGAACANYFKNTYDVITVARTGDVTIKGDLREQSFLQQLVEQVVPAVFINNAGLISADFNETYLVNVMAASFLASQYYEKMQQGHIINICSTAAHLRGWPQMSQERIFYLSSKAALKNLGTVLQDSRRTNVKVTNLEPGLVNTDFAGGKVEISEGEYRKQTASVLPMKPEDIARTIEWVLQQPPYLVIPTLQLDNFYPILKK